MKCQEKAIIWIISQTYSTKGTLSLQSFILDWLSMDYILENSTLGKLEQSEPFRLLCAFNVDTQMDKDQQCEISILFCAAMVQKM